MVNLVEEWKYIEEHTQYLARYGKVGSYQLRKSEEGVEIKVCIGPYGYVGEFKQAEDPELIKILAFLPSCKIHKSSGKPRR